LSLEITINQSKPDLGKGNQSPRNKPVRSPQDDIKRLAEGGKKGIAGTR
jgi:hypothetical protein